MWLRLRTRSAPCLPAEEATDSRTSYCIISVRQGLPCMQGSWLARAATRAVPGLLNLCKPLSQAWQHPGSACPHGGCACTPTRCPVHVNGWDAGCMHLDSRAGWVVTVGFRVEGLDRASTGCTLQACFSCAVQSVCTYPTTYWSLLPCPGHRGLAHVATARSCIASRNSAGCAWACSSPGSLAMVVLLLLQTQWSASKHAHRTQHQYMVVLLPVPPVYSFPAPALHRCRTVVNTLQKGGETTMYEGRSPLSKAGSPAPDCCPGRAGGGGAAAGRLPVCAQHACGCHHAGRRLHRSLGPQVLRAHRHRLPLGQVPRLTPSQSECSVEPSNGSGCPTSHLGSEHVHQHCRMQRMQLHVLN